MVALSAFNTTTGGLEIGDWLYSAKPLAAPEYLPLNDDTASYLSSSYPTLAATYAPTTVAYSAAAQVVPRSIYGYNMIAGNKILLGWSSTGAIATSTDGVTWTASGINRMDTLGGQFVGANQPIWSGMAYGRGRFVAIRNAAALGTSLSNPYGCSAVSTNGGATWELGGLTPTILNTSSVIGWFGVTYTGTGFVAAGWWANGTTRQVVTAVSPDGISWGQYTTNATTFSSVYNVEGATIGFGNGVVVAAVSENTGGFSRIIYSSNGATWTTTGINLSPTPDYSGATYGNGLFVLVSKTAGANSPGAATATYYTSPTGVTWTARSFPAALLNWSITYANGYFLATGNSSTVATTTVYTSTDAITWTAQTVPSLGATLRRYIPAGIKNKFFYTVDVPTEGCLINLSAAASTFTLPIIPPLPGTQTYMKAT